MENAVKDCILEEQISDTVLGSLIELTIHSIVSGRPIFPDILAEPAFFRRYFSKWVTEGLEEREKLKRAERNAKDVVDGV